MLRRVIVVVAFLLVASPAAADRGKSRTVAVILGAAGTTVSMGLIVASTLAVPNDQDVVVNQPLFISGLASSIVTPSLGQIYAGTYLTPGMGIRAGAGVLAFIGAGMTEDHRCNIDKTCTELTQKGVIVLGLAGITYIAGIAYDLAVTTDAVDSYNRKHGIFMGVARAIDNQPTPLVGIGGRW